MRRGLVSLLLAGLCAVALVTFALTQPSEAPSPLAAPATQDAPDMVIWPTDIENVRAMLERFPSSVDGLTKNPIQDSDGGASIDFGGSYPRLPSVMATQPLNDMTVDEMFVYALWWTGCNGHDPDFRSSTNVATMMADPSIPEGTLLPVLPPGGSEPTWLECTSVNDMENGGELSDNERSRNRMWIAGDWVYLVEGSTVEQRAEMVQMLSEAASADPT